MKPAWLEIAERDVGVNERDNPERILEYHSHTSLNSKSVKTPWCASAMSCWLEEAGYDSPHSARARDFLEWGREPENGEYEGAICIIWRGSPDADTGHVGILTDWSENQIELLAGNQGDAVNKQWWNVDRALGYRVPV